MQRRFTWCGARSAVSFGMARTTLLITLLLVAFTAACVPSVEAPRVEVQQLTEPVSFYPRETGARWTYVADGASLAGIRYVETIEGPSVIDGDVWIAFRLVGGGQDVTHYRQFRDDGVYLRRQVRPGAVIDFDPPIREYPAQDELRVGLTWRAETVADQRYPSAAPGLRHMRLDVEYVYTVIDFRPVTVAGESYEVYVIDRTVRQYDEDGGIQDELSRILWFAPRIGIVRHENGWFLVDTNVTAEQP